MFLAAFTSALQAYPQATQPNRAWLSRLPAAMCPHAEHRWLVYAAVTFSTRPGAFCSRRRTSTPQPEARMARLSPALARTFRPGAGAGTGSGTAANATCQRPARSRVTRNVFASRGTCRDQRNRTHPA